MSSKSLRIIPTPHFLEEGGQLLLLAEGGRSRVFFQVGTSDMEKLAAVMTLLQLLRGRAGKVSVREVHIRDYPDFKRRAAADWLLFNEISRWGYDWGDGREAYVRRVERKLDFCLRYKINMVCFDGFSWNEERFPGYAEMTRELNRFARQRGIKLVLGGYGMGYGASGGADRFRNDHLFVATAVMNGNYLGAEAVR